MGKVIATLACLVSHLFAAGTAQAVERIELSVGRIDGAAVEVRDLRATWTPQGEFSAQARVGAPALGPQPADLQLRCAVLAAAADLRCDGGELRVSAGTLAQGQARFAVRGQSALRWQLELARLQATLGYNSADGRVASDGLALELAGSARQDASGRSARFDLRSAKGQAYVEPLFVDFGQHAMHVRAELRQGAHASRLDIGALDATLAGIGDAQLRGSLDLRQAAQKQNLSARLRVTALAPAVELFAKPWLAGTRIDDIQAGGAAILALDIVDARPQRVDLALEHVDFASRKLGATLNGIAATLAWRADGTAPPSHIAWHDGAIGALPFGAASAPLQLEARGFALRDTLAVPILDGALRIATLRASGLGSDALAGDFDATLEPIDLAALCRAFAWPEFGGTLSGRLPGLKLRDGVLSFDGGLRAQAFDGELTLDGLRVIDPLGVLPRVTADIAVRRVDLAQLTGAFSFGRIEGRLDGDVAGLRLLGWEPVAMDARLYTTPGDRSRHRISQKAIDNISSIGGGPTGLLSHGALSFFKNFAYDRIGWRCRLDNGTCHMDGIETAKDGRGYVLVKGRLLPRIDVVGYNRQVSWNTFIEQLKGVAQANAAEVKVR
ncbi:MAG: hypothetical protein ACREVL_05480 [Solimonas sp.]